MLITVAQLRHVVVLFVTLLFAAAMILSCAPHKSAACREADKIEIETTNTLESFEKEYMAIRKEVEEGSLSGEVMSRATEIQIGLQKYLLKVEAELEILRLNVLHGGDDQRERALNQIVALVEEREQIKISYLQQLQGLRMGSKTSQHKKGTIGTIKDPDIKIKIAPEDISDGKRP